MEEREHNVREGGGNTALPNLKNIPFVAVRRAIMRGSQCEATARSATMAQRIVNALNKYEPGERGK
jgi:hypothetical protein